MKAKIRFSNSKCPYLSLACLMSQMSLTRVLMASARVTSGVATSRISWIMANMCGFGIFVNRADSFSPSLNS